MKAVVYHRPGHIEVNDVEGMLENTPQNLRRWIEHAGEVNPHTAMPEQGVTDRDASDMVAYLHTTR